MGLETKETEIDGLKFVCTNIPARRSLKLQFKLGKLLLPFIGTLVSGNKNSESLLDNDVSIESLGNALQLLFDKLSDTVFLNLIIEIFQHTKINGQDVKDDASFDAIFNGHPFAVYKGVMFVLQMEYGSFLEEGGIGQLLKSTNQSKELKQ